MATNSKTKNTEPQVHYLDQYIKDADLAPFVLQVSADEVLEIAQPTRGQLKHLAQGLRDGDEEVVLAAVTGDHYPRVAELFDGQPFRASAQFLNDLLEHFNYDDMAEMTLRGPGGGLVTESDPKKIQGLLRVGYEVVGE